MAAIDPISSLFAQASPVSPTALRTPSPSAAAVGAFQSAMSAPDASGDTAAFLGSIFGNSAVGVESPEMVAAPILKIPGNFEYLPGTVRTLESVLPSLPESLPSPVELLSAQMKISAIQLEWQFLAKATGTAVQGVQSLVNSQV